MHRNLSTVGSFQTQELSGLENSCRSGVKNIPTVLTPAIFCPAKQKHRSTCAPPHAGGQADPNGPGYRYDDTGGCRHPSQTAHTQATEGGFCFEGEHVRGIDPRQGSRFRVGVQSGPHWTHEGCVTRFATLTMMRCSCRGWRVSCSMLWFQGCASHVRTEQAARRSDC